ncbi:uncharacterized protein [Diadema setosum]|uniref:uncharacterized protein n=1 Tax=Diadema setosum TaxID=31175 RepID=UPI003B3AB7AE
MPTPDPPALIRMDASLSEDRSGKLRYVKPLNQQHIMNRPNLLRLLESQPQPLQNVASQGMPSGGDESKVEIRSSPKMMDFVAESLQTLSEGEGLRQRHINVTPIVKNDLNTPLTESGPLVLPSHSRMKNPVCDSMGTGDNEESLGEDDFLSTTSSLESQSKDIRGDKIVTQDVMKDSGAGSQEGVLLPEDIPPSPDNNRQACSKEEACLMTKDLGRDPEMSPSHETDDTDSEESKRYREEGAANRSLARQPVPTASISSSGISSPTISPKETYEMFAAPSSRSIHLGKPFLDHKLSGLPCGIDAVKRQSQLNVDFAKTSASVTVLGSTQPDNLCEISSHKSRCRRYKNNRSSKRPGTSVVEEEPVEVDAFGNYYGNSVLFPYHPKDLHLIDYNPILRGSVYGARETTYPDYLYIQAHAKDIERVCCAGYQDPSVDSSGFSQSGLQGVLSDYQYMLESSRSFLANASGDTCSVEKHRLSPGQEADIQDALRIIIGSNHIPPTLDAAEVLANYGSMILNNETIRQEFIMFCEQLVVKQMLCGQSEHGQGDSWLLNGNSQSGLFSSGLYQQWYPHNPALYFDGDAFVSIGVSMDSHGNLCLLLPEDHPDRRGLPDSVSVYSTPNIAALCVQI